MALLCASFALAAAAVFSQTVPATGTAVPGMASYDALASFLMTKYHVPGGAIAVVKDGKLLFARGYGYADTESQQLVQPDSLFRVASLSKAITAAAILQLVEENRLSLDARVFDLLDQYHPLPGATVDPRIHDITIRELLTHSGGWNRDTTFDPMFLPIAIANIVGVPAPADDDAIIRFMLGQPLQFTPGQDYNYSNFGYALLGRVIEKITGISYENYVKGAVLLPAGITCMSIGHSLPSQRLPNEVRYYDYPGAPLATSIYGSGSVPWPDGGFYLEALDSDGGWVGSTIDYLRFVTAVDGLPTRPDILVSATIRTMTARPPITVWAGQLYWYAMGWLVRPSGNDANWWHDGSLPGTSTYVVRAYNGVTWVAFFNSRPASSQFFVDLDAGLWDALAGVTVWPTIDQFDGFGVCSSGFHRRAARH